MGNLSQEAEFFDRKAERNSQELRPIDEAILRRYRNPGRLYPKECGFRLLGNLRDKSILDVGCGEGEDAMILARLGARVIGLDVSPRSIELARERAALNGVADRTRFLFSPLSRANLPPHSFDVIWIDNVLHHVLDELEPTLDALLAAAKPGATVLCLEPVNLNQTLRRIRFLVPVHTEVTPGERPLEKRDLAVLERLIPGLRRRHFNFLGRLERFILPDFRYEQAPAWRQTVCDLIRGFDRLFLDIPGLEQLGGVGLLYGNAAAG
jgi:2-polyprenyl-3-methyl-5-hydroxy-6-metoxy-1,4-benzoquinol methylase